MQKKVLILLGVLACSAVLIWIYLLLSSQVGNFLAAGIYLGVFWVVLRVVVHTVMFPGSSWFMKRSIEVGFCKEMTAQVLYKLRDLKLYLEGVSLRKDVTGSEASCYYNLSQLKFVLQTIETNLESLSSLSFYQKRLLEALTGLHHSLELIVLKYGSTSYNFWEWLEEVSQATEPYSIELDRFQDLGPSIECCSCLEMVLHESCGKKKLLGSFKRFLFDNSVGSISYMRTDLFKRFDCEELLIETEDHKSIDAVLVKQVNEKPLMLLCNPNAGCFEYSYFQSEWLEFYSKLGFNLVLWNYRGYGSTSGIPFLKNILSDGELIIHYLRTEKGYDRIGVHGESLGGSIACYLARECQLDFLFADRTFSSLQAVSLCGFGIATYWLHKLARLEDIDTVEEYLEAQCYKVISCDPKDTMVKDLASLKAGVANRLLLDSDYTLNLNLKRFVGLHILTQEEFLQLLGILKRTAGLTEIVPPSSKLGVSASESSFMKSELKSVNEYQFVSKEFELLEDEQAMSFLGKVANILEDLDAGGKSLKQVAKSKNSKAELLNWMLVFDIWGSWTFSLPEYETDTILKAVIKLRTHVEEMNSIIELGEQSPNKSILDISKDLKSLKDTFLKILAHMEIRAGITALEDDSIISESSNQSLTFRNNVDLVKAGCLLPLRCGHSGGFSSAEKTQLFNHLQNSGFIT